MVKDLKGLARYPWTGHSALLGEKRRDWQGYRDDSKFIREKKKRGP